MHLGKVFKRTCVVLVFGALCVVPMQQLRAQSPAQPGGGGGSATSMVWKVTSNYKFKVQIAFYSRERNHEWPGNGQAWDLNDYNQHTYTLNCRRGEKICFGAWVTGNANKYWGVGFGGKQGCSTCCFTCGQVPQAQVLQ